MSELGQRLRAAREAKGLTLVQAEEATRIRRDYLQALEEERYDALPGAVYVRGFLRNYAAYLGLDAQATLAEYRAGGGAASATAVQHGAETGAPAGVQLPQVLDRPLLVPSRRSGHPVRTVLLALLAVLVLGAGAWYLYSRLVLDADPWPMQWIASRLDRSPTATPPPPTATPDAASTAAPRTPTQAVAATSTPTATTPVSTPPATHTATPSPTRTRTAIPTATPAQPTPTPSPTLGEGFLVTLRVNALCYVRVVLDGVMVLEKNLAVGEDQRWEPRQSLELRVGNAGGVVLAVNGVEQPPLGTGGEIVDVSYTLGSLP